MSEIKILQLSDLHLVSSNTKDPQIILNALWRDLENFKGIDFILFTGDLVMGGDSKESFDKAYEIFIAPLLEKTKVKKENFFLVPGNHEVQLKAVDDILESGLKSALTDRDSVNKFIDKQIESEFRQIERLGHFYDFKIRVIGSGEAVTINKLYSTHVVAKNGIKIGIACLNSAWRANGKGGNGEMLIGERQVYECLNDIQECDIKIAMHHHPLDWLTEDDKYHTEEVLFREFDFTFCGHLHHANLNMIRNLENEIVVIQGGSLFKGRSHHNGYSVLSIDPKKGQGTLYLRTYFDASNKFTKAVDRCEEGQLTIPLKGEKLNINVDKNQMLASPQNVNIMTVNIGKISGKTNVGETIAVNTEFKEEELPKSQNEFDLKIGEVNGPVNAGKHIKIKEEVSHGK
jgi:predicted MPP superfamily phosphohydrolase